VSGEAEELARLLAGQDPGPVEKAGATRMLSVIAGGPVTAEMHVHARPLLTARRRRLLQAAGQDVHERRGRLVDEHGATVADTTAWVVTGRVPAGARLALGITPDGVRHADGKGTPLGSALAGCGVTRDQGPVTLEPAPCGGSAVVSAALLRLIGGTPLALVHETVCARWLAAHPPPWPL